MNQSKYVVTISININLRYNSIKWKEIKRKRRHQTFRSVLYVSDSFSLNWIRHCIRTHVSLTRLQHLNLKHDLLRANSGAHINICYCHIAFDINGIFMAMNCILKLNRALAFHIREIRCDLVAWNDFRKKWKNAAGVYNCGECFAWSHLYGKLDKVMEISLVS